MQAELEYLRERLSTEQEEHDTEMSKKDLDILRLENQLQAKKYE